jgi:hypothetical protein
MEGRDESVEDREVGERGVRCQQLRNQGGYIGIDKNVKYIIAVG